MGKMTHGQNDPGRNNLWAKRLTGKMTHGRKDPVPPQKAHTYIVDCLSCYLHFLILMQLGVNLIMARAMLMGCSYPLGFMVNSYIFNLYLVNS